MKRRTGIAVVAPGGYAPRDRDLGRAVTRLEDHGWRVKMLVEPGAAYQRFGATDDGRVAQLHAAAADEDIDIVLALRGGYGMSRILPLLDLDLLAGSGKLFVGHSDFTALQMALLAHAGAPSFAGPMICDDFTREDASGYTLDGFRRCLAGPEHAVRFAHPANPDVETEGLLWGGNLTMLAHLAGTPWMPHIEDGLLFIEDVNEHPYRVERMLLQLHHAGVLRRQRAILFGDFTGYRLADYDNGYDFEAMLDYIRGLTGIPLLRGLPFGHVRDKATLAVGAAARLQCAGGECVLRMSGYPSLAGRAAA
ncbi:muramoyltetrapeptide carboxypeptidase [Noviherbaspirillum aridicola]|uniref:L,D-carboxypeptidase A n=1 Tax=Noviherbaspirillum aridicola TaxID=2849687 RepID=A0ABQ4Q252_9BURK|nr:muramoyltetrapeptide carboxypeptidase [Noviherbaspirillum aridicola]GIZ51225.1 L,D-carboxypeptidase A [Noviherbaspirillum aridicola]